MATTASPAPFYGQYRIPGVEEQVHFGVGQPAPSLLPLARVRAATAAKLAEEDPLLLQYGFISGYATFRASLARFLEAGYGKPAGSVDSFSIRPASTGSERPVSVSGTSESLPPR